MPAIMKILAAVCMLSVAQAHNWLVNPSRSRFASTKFPSIPKRSAAPQIQVARNQPFEISWATGHSGFSYFALIHENDSAKLELHRSELLDRYFKEAPTTGDGVNTAQTQRWMRYHRSTNADFNKAPCPPIAFLTPDPNKFCPQNWARILPASDRDHLGPQPFPPGTGNTLSPKDGSTNRRYLFEYKPTDIAEDRTAAYENPDMPWILRAAKYKHTSGLAADVDAARFEIPSHNHRGGGKYIVHWIWGGYYDAVDVEFFDRDAAIPFPYGTVPSGVFGAKVVRRIDHCMFPTPLRGYGPAWEVREDAQACIKKCLATTGSGGECNGINLYPLTIPISSKINGDFLKPGHVIDQQIEASYQHQPQGSVRPDEYRNYMPQEFSNNQTYNDGRLKELRDEAAKNPQMMACLPLTSRAENDDNTLGKFEITDDPEDPIFYSTCFDVQLNFDMIGYNTSLVAPADEEEDPDSAKWNYVNSCVSCGSAAYNIARKVPFWQLSNVCMNCDILPPVQVVRPVSSLIAVPSNSSFFGVGFVSPHDCVKLLSPSGACNSCAGNQRKNGVITTQAEVAGLAVNDPDCLSTPRYFIDTLGGRRAPKSGEEHTAKCLMTSAAASARKGSAVTCPTAADVITATPGLVQIANNALSINSRSIYDVVRALPIPDN